MAYTFKTHVARPGVYMELGLPTRTAWTAAAHAIDDEVSNDDRNWRCILAHDAAVITTAEPGVGDDWTTYWELIRYPLLGATPGGGFGLRDPRSFKDAAEPAAVPLIEQLIAGQAGYVDTYAIAIYNVASASHQGRQTTVLDQTPWAPGSYTIGDYALYDYGDGAGSVLIRSRGTHTAVETAGATVGNEPSSAATPTGGGPIGLVLWDKVDPQDCGQPRIAGRGEMDPGFGRQAARDIQTLNAFARRNAEALGLTGEVGNYGPSAGAVNTFQAAVMGDAPHAAGDNADRLHAEALGFSGRPDFCILEIMPARWEQFLTEDRSDSPGYSLFLSFLTSFYGNARLGDWEAWRQYPDDLKRSIDPYWILRERREVPPPIYFINYGASTWNSSTRWDDPADPLDIYNGNNSLSQVVDVHHAYHAFVCMQVLCEPLADGGMGLSEGDYIVHASKGQATDIVQRSTRYPDGTNGTLGTDYTEIDTTPGWSQTLGEDVIDWMNARLA